MFLYSFFILWRLNKLLLLLLLLLLLVSFAITLNHRQTFLLHSNTLACVKAEIWPMLRNSHFSKIVQNHSGVVMFTYSIYEY